MPGRGPDHPRRRPAGPDQRHPHVGGGGDPVAGRPEPEHGMRPHRSDTPAPRPSPMAAGITPGPPGTTPMPAGTAPRTTGTAPRHQPRADRYRTSTAGTTPMTTGTTPGRDPREPCPRCLLPSGAPGFGRCAAVPGRFMERHAAVANLPGPGIHHRRRRPVAQYDRAVTEITETAPGWLSPEELELTRARMPILYVDAVPVRVDSSGMVTHVGL